ncbi:MAG: RNA methyltransferase [Syntrophomonadaceae bacterium]|jgi:TrmH family RNA methyltransferase|nr:RNA methyltransferase [Syntrophomonadaceae bacterium]
MKEIKSRDNQKIREAARLKDNKYRQREKLFLIEGRTLFAEAVQRGQELLRVFVDTDRVEQYLDEYRKSRNAEWIKVDSGLIKYICDTQTPQGIVAVARIPQWDFEPWLQKSGLLIYLDGLADPGNLGTILRTAWAFGVSGVMLGPGCVDPFNPKVVRSSMGAVFSVPIVFEVSAEALAQSKETGYRLMASSLNTDISISEVDFTGAVVIIIGNEARGISSKVLKLCDSSFKIPIFTPVDSLNAAVACGIILYEARKHRGT